MLRTKLGFWVFVILNLLFLGFPKPSLAQFLPPARITFTIDDGTKRIYDNARPLFQSHNFPAVVYGETLHLGNGEDWVMTWDQLKELRDQLGWEIGSHSVTHPDLTKLTDQQLDQELANSKATFAANGINTQVFSSPFGLYDTRVLKAISRYYTSHRAAWGGPNIWPEIYDDYQLQVYEIKHTTTPSEVKTWIDDAVNNRQWLVFLLHDIVTTTPVEYEYHRDDLKTILDYIATKPVQVLTTSQGLNLGQGPNLVPNASFEQLKTNGFAANWTRTHTTPITINTANNGNAPNPKNSLKMVGGPTQREAVSAFIPISPSNSYVLKMFEDGTAFTSGGWSVWFSEYDTANNYLGGQWLGGNFAAHLGTRYYTYTPTSTAVTKIKIHLYTEAGSVLTVYLDSLDLRVLSQANPPAPTITSVPPTPTPTSISPSPTPTTVPSPTISITPTPTPTTPPSANLISNGSFENLQNNFATNWSTGNPSQVSVDNTNQGSGASPLHSLKIIASSTQNTAISSRVNLPNSSGTYRLSYYLKTSPYVSGGTAAYVDEYGAAGNWLGGKWLGGRYATTDGQVTFNYQPTSSSVTSLDLHLFTEEGSNMSAYLDDVVFALN